MMRLLVDVMRVHWDEAWELTKKSVSTALAGSLFAVRVPELRLSNRFESRPELHQSHRDARGGGGGREVLAALVRQSGAWDLAVPGAGEVACGDDCPHAAPPYPNHRRAFSENPVVVFLKAIDSLSASFLLAASEELNLRWALA